MTYVRDPNKSELQNIGLARADSLVAAATFNASFPSANGDNTYVARLADGYEPASLTFRRRIYA